FGPVQAVDRCAHSGSEPESAPVEGMHVPSAYDATIALAATDPASSYGAALSWPPLPIPPPEGATARPARRAGALVLLTGGKVTAFVDKGAKHLLWWADGPATPDLAAQLVRAVAEDSRLPQLRIERINAHPIGAAEVTAIGEALVAAGCYRSPRAIRLRAGDR